MLTEKLKVAESKAKKYVEALNDVKRKLQVIQEKKATIKMLQTQLEQYKEKVQRFDKITAQNAELVTRKCALESSILQKDKKIQEQSDKLRQLESIVQ